MSLSGDDVIALSPEHEKLLVKYVSDVRTKKIVGADNEGLAAITLLENIINDCTNSSAYELCALVRAAGRALSRSLRAECVAANVARRVLRALRDEMRAATDESGSSLQRLVLASGRRATLPRHAPAPDLIRDYVAELRLEIESSTSGVRSVLGGQLRGGEAVLAGGGGALVGAALAGRGGNVLVCEGNDHRQTALMATKLANSGVKVTLTGYATAVAVMTRVNKVVLEGAAVCGGGALCGAGAAALCAAARQNNVPVLVLCPLHRMSPLHAQQQLQHLGPPPGDLYRSSWSADLSCLAPEYDLVPAEHITLFVTNQGCSSPSYIYRLMSELYDQHDYQL